MHWKPHLEKTQMINIYLFIELLGAANAETTLERVKNLELTNCKFANLVQLSDEKLVAQLDCDSYADASKAVLDRIAPVDGIVQTNIIASVRPVRR
jgi:hypothetical protein